MARNQFNTRLDTEILEKARKQATQDGLALNDVIEALLDLYSKGEFQIEKRIEKKVTYTVKEKEA